MIGKREREGETGEEKYKDSLDYGYPFPVTDSETDSYQEKTPYHKKIIHEVKKVVNPIATFAWKTADRLRYSDNIDNDKQMAEQYPDLEMFAASATDGKTEISEGEFSILLDKSNGNTIYENIVGGPITKRYKELNVLDMEPRKIYAVKFTYPGNETYINVFGCYKKESVVKNEENPDTVDKVDDLVFYYLEMKEDGQLVTESVDYTLFKLTQNTFDLTVETAAPFPSTEITTVNLQDDTETTTTTWHWDEEIAEETAKKALMIILRQMAYQIYGKYPDDIKVYKYNVEEYAKESLTTLKKQSPLTPINVNEIIGQFLISNKVNQKDFLKNLEKLQGIPPTNGARLDAILRQSDKQKSPYDLMQWQDRGKSPELTKEEQKQKIREARLATFKKTESGGSLKKTKKKRSKKQKKTKKHRKTNKHRKHRSNKSKKHKR